MSSRFSVIDISTLPPLEVLESLDSEALLRQRLTKLKELWAAADPPFGAQYDVDGLEFDPLKITEELATYFELLLRDRVNQATRATTLAFASDGDLDGIASRYPGGVPRQDGESDERYRRRIWLSANSFTTAGAAEAYQFQALTAEPSLRDVSVTMVKRSVNEPVVVVTAMSERADPRPTADELERVRQRLHDPGVKPLTDVVIVRAPRLLVTGYKAKIWLFPGPDADVVLASVNQRIAALIEEQRWLGYDHTRNALHAALHAPGVQNALIDEPTADIAAGPTEAVKVESVEVRLMGRAE